MRLHVERSGVGRDLVLLHGWSLHGGVWSALLARLATGHRLHVVDLPGHGRSRALPFADLDAAADAIAREIPQGAILCGWSLGGLLALRLAARHAPRTAALALVSTTPCFVERPDWPNAMKAATFDEFAEGLRTDPEGTVGRFVKLATLGGPQARAAARALADELVSRGPTPPRSLAAGLRALRATDLRDSVGQIDCPTVVIHGRRDALVPVEAGRWLARSLPRARLTELEDAAHVPLMSHATRVADAIESLHG
jgi:pimeloyl-[acyl-carrier protein] methyl ester esterase